MGGYVLTNNRNDGIRENILSIFEKKGMRNHTVVDLGVYQLFYFNKINLPEANHIYANGANRIIGIGTFAYGGHFGYQALESLYNDVNSAQDIEPVLNNIKGHFNIILYMNEEIVVVADRVGAYHSFIGREGENVYLSNSLYAVADNLSKLTVRKQEMMEFLVTESIYGPNTLFEEIKFLEFGKTHCFLDNGEVISNQYHQVRTAKEGYGVEDHYDAIVKYVSLLKDVELTISPDITAGYDSRQMCAILKHLGVRYTLNTNYNSWDTTDLDVAETIAEKEGTQLLVYQKDLTKIPYSELLDNSVMLTELYRDIFQAAYSYVFFDEKTKDSNMIIGGYGGELYRDTKYHGFDSIDALIKAKYEDTRVTKLFDAKEVQQYRDGLANKMKSIIGHNEDHLSKIDCEKIYYFLRMMYWGGSRITYFNYYGYRYHPLLDYELIFPLFYIGDDKKHDGKYQMQIIERFDREMASYQSNYGHNFIWEEAKHNLKSPPRFHTRVLKFGVRKLRSTFLPGSQQAQSTTSWQDEEDRMIWKNYVSDDLHIVKYFDNLEVKGNERYLGRIYSIELFLERYKTKIKELE